MTEKEMHDSYLADAYQALKEATEELQRGDYDSALVCICGAGFSLCSIMPPEYTEMSPDVWYERGC